MPYQRAPYLRGILTVLPSPGCKGVVWANQWKPGRQLPSRPSIKLPIYFQTSCSFKPSRSPPLTSARS